MLLADHRMPGMTGVDLLEQSIELFPDAKRILLTAYADIDAAIRAINTVGLDYYLLKPWDPPEEKLYPVLDDLLVFPLDEDWMRALLAVPEAQDLLRRLVSFEGAFVRRHVLLRPGALTLKLYGSRRLIPIAI